MNNNNETMGSVREAFDAATVLLKHGQVTHAEAQLREILRVAPEEVNSLRLLGDLLISHKGHAAEGLKLLEQTVRLAPGFGQGVVSLVRAQLRIQRFEDAASLLDELLGTSDHPSGQSSELWQLYADALFETGRDDDARTAQQRSIDLDPFKDAMRRAITASMHGHPRETESVYREILKANPDHVHALVGLANIALDRNVAADAERLLNHANEVSPNMSPVHRGFARLYMSQSRFPEARAAAERATQLNPEIADNWTSLGTVLAWGLQQDAAVEAFKQSLSLNEKQPRVLLSLGHVLKALGDQPGSERAYHQSIDARPTLGEAWWSLADLKTYRFSDNELNEMQQLIGSTGLQERDQSALHFALGKAFEDRGDASRSFHHYQEGNRIRHQFESFNVDRFNTQCAELKRVFTAATIERRRSTAKDSQPVPIFVIGLPRSGSTLVDQILSSHSQVQGTMELPHILGYVRDMQRDGEDSSYPNNLMTLSRQDLEALGQRYLDETAAYHHHAPYFVDKMPNNFMHVGLIHCMLPNAIFIDTRRHPMACCFSIYKQNFARGQTFSYDLGTLAAYYRGYLDVMKHWQTVLPGHVHRVVYEAMVDDSEQGIRALLEHCSLPFEEQCLRFHENERVVRTASASQVRQPIYTSAKDHWQQFEAELRPLTDALGDTLENWRT